MLQYFENIVSTLKLWHRPVSSLHTTGYTM